MEFDLIIKNANVVFEDNVSMCHIGAKNGKIASVFRQCQELCAKLITALVEIYYRGRLSRPLITFQQAGRKGSRAAVRRSSCS